jgi:hypothetical protein
MWTYVNTCSRKQRYWVHHSPERSMYGQWSGYILRLEFWDSLVHYITPITWTMINVVCTLTTLPQRCRGIKMRKVACQSLPLPVLTSKHVFHIHWPRHINLARKRVRAIYYEKILFWRKLCVFGTTRHVFDATEAKPRHIFVRDCDNCKRLADFDASCAHEMTQLDGKYRLAQVEL